MIPTEELTDPTVRSLVAAINVGDRAAFMAMLTTDATMSDDGADQNLEDWVDREIFSSGGHMDVESESEGGRSLIARYRNDTYGEMRTSWTFTVRDGLISRMEAGQA